MLATCIGLALCLGVATSMAATGATELPVVKACGHRDCPPWNWLRDAASSAPARWCRSCHGELHELLDEYSRIYLEKR